MIIGNPLVNFVKLLSFVLALDILYQTIFWKKVFIISTCVLIFVLSFL